MAINDFVQHLSDQKRQTKRMILASGDQGQTLSTKISGTPWWPSDRGRPRCKDGHAMAFMVQILLSDVPRCSLQTPTLLSFHYCVECMHAGRMSHGYGDLKVDRCYDLSLFTNLSQAAPDRQGVLASPCLKPCTVRLSEVSEVPSIEDMSERVVELLPDDYPQFKDDFDDNVYPGLIHVQTSKLGGWPSWMQRAEWPEWEEDADILFMGQLHWVLGEATPWGGGGCAYIFISTHDAQAQSAELLIQTT